MPPTDDEIREMAKARVGFRAHAGTYVLVNILLAIIWYFTEGPGSSYWPIWAHAGWGIGLASHAWSVYGGGKDAVAREEAKLREKHGMR